MGFAPRNIGSKTYVVYKVYNRQTKNPTENPDSQNALGATAYAAFFPACAAEKLSHKRHAEAPMPR